MLQAEQQLWRIIRYSDIAKLVIAIERRHLNPRKSEPRQRSDRSAAQLATFYPSQIPGGIAAEVPRRSRQPLLSRTRKLPDVLDDA
jgi:hypothetical protein